MVSLLILLLLVTSCAEVRAQEIDYSCLDPVVEMRGVWLDAGAVPKTEDGLRDLVRAYHRANINLIFPEVIARGYTVYPSKLVARDPRFVGAPDILAILIREAHALGMEVHPWVWVFRAGYTNDRGAILSLHPDWAELSRDGKELSPNGGYWISPVIPDARDFLARLYAELVSQYDVDGIHLDYIRYESEDSASYGYGELSRDLFRRQYGVDPLEIGKLSFHQYEWQKFRERQINTFVQRIALQTRALKPHAMVSAAVGSQPKSARLSLMQNWINWVDNKWVDFVAPMTYSSDDAHFRGLVKLLKDAIAGKTLFMPGIGLFAQKDPRQVATQIAITRELNTGGQVLFASSYLKDPHDLILSAGPYSEASAQPFRDTWSKSRALAEHAARLRSRGEEAEASFHASRAVMLADYASYREANTGYIAPDPPPLEIPDYVIALPTVEIGRVAEPIRVDGRLDDESWRGAASVRLLYTNGGADAPVKTTAYLAYDASVLYIAFESCEPDRANIRAEVGRRDDPVFQDDSVEVFIDPTNRRKEYYHFATNTLETIFDQKVSNPAWDTDWRTASRVDATSWTTEIAIPFSSLGVAAPSPGSRWALNLTRNRRVTGELEHFTWSVPYGSFHNAERFGLAVFR